MHVSFACLSLGGRSRGVWHCQKNGFVDLCCGDDSCWNDTGTWSFGKKTVCSVLSGRARKGNPEVFPGWVCGWALRSIAQGTDPWLPARLWMELWQLVKMILQKTVGCEDNQPGCEAGKGLGSKQSRWGRSCGGLITAGVPWAGWTCRYVGSYLTLLLISYFFTLVTKL